jgi:phospholipase C
VNTVYDKRSGAVAVVIQNLGSRRANVSVLDAYSGQTQTYLLEPKQTVTYANSLQESVGWYDLTIRVNSDPSFQRQLAGHVETGRSSVTDPAIGG